MWRCPKLIAQFYGLLMEKLGKWSTFQFCTKFLWQPLNFISGRSIRGWETWWSSHLRKSLICDRNILQILWKLSAVKEVRWGSVTAKTCLENAWFYSLARKFQRRFIDGKEGGDLKSFISLVTGQNQRPHKRPRNPPPLIFTQLLHQMDNYLRVLVTYHNEKLWHWTAEKCFEYHGMLKQRAL